ncbi:MAG: Gfo/Idh/MocA family oxidoreductase [Lewinellaceae bacterium]|nr:Gfo/Idh/MocA family oxidoreductase [Lewinellaceae bacterium]
MKHQRPKIGLVGVGHLGKIHVKCLKDTPFDFVGIYDVDETLKLKIASEFGLKAFSTFDELLEVCDCVDIVAPTTAHFELAKKAIQHGKHIFIEKPVTETLEQALELDGLSKIHHSKVQVGHVERYNPAILSLKDTPMYPRFVEVHRLAQFNPRGTDVSVVLDLMIHDIDIVLSMIKSPVKSIVANGVSIVSASPDICNSRIEFEDGAVANLTASRISLKNMRKIRVFQDNAYISLDFLEKSVQIVRIEPAGSRAENEMTISTNEGLKRIIIESPNISSNNAIVDELNDFYRSVAFDEPVSVTLGDGIRALEVAFIIQSKIS